LESGSVGTRLLFVTNRENHQLKSLQVALSQPRGDCRVHGVEAVALAYVRVPLQVRRADPSLRIVRWEPSLSRNRPVAQHKGAEDEMVSQSFVPDDVVQCALRPWPLVRRVQCRLKSEGRPRVFSTLRRRVVWRDGRTQNAMALVHLIKACPT
jgi:hypothetical protein